MKLIRAELLKLATLPASWLSTALAVILPAGVAALNSRGDVPRGVDAGFQPLAVGVIGAIVLGVAAVSSEYLAEGAESGGGRQVTTSLTAAASRSRFLLAKAAALSMTVASLALVSSAITLTTTSLTGTTISTGELPRVVGVTAYWILTALLAGAITLVTRSGIIPLTFFIVNMSVVSVSFLLTKVTRLANYLPDLAGMRMFLRDLRGSAEIAPVTGGLVMGLWVVLVAAIGVTVFTRRDA
ncbi:hypothetical protein PWY87_08350 [Kribbella solani]|uniref:hypothetical protein n=1 Tax=Kribbella solani TaxID=236067 RepID=UPI0029A9E35B|nr:hypothetical protein [Kribbella solani]MDX3001672.1 hypothetical protein [Kribbella solani]